jgi:hypothetical protein
MEISKVGLFLPLTLRRAALHACIHYPTQRPGSQIISLSVKTKYSPFKPIFIPKEWDYLKLADCERFNVMKT